MTTSQAMASVLALACCAAPVSAQTTSLGPLTFEEGAPLHRLSYTPMAEAPDPVSRGELGFDVWLGYSNIFEQDSAATHWLFVDMERLTTTTTVRYGLADRLEIGGRLTLESTGGGVLDSFIVWWHDKLSLGNANRDRYPPDSYGQVLEGEGDRVLLDVGRRAFALEDVRFFAKWLVASSADEEDALSLRAVARIPVHANRVGEERADVALMALGRLRAGGWFLHGHIGGSTLRSSPELDDVLRPAAGFFMIGAERPLSANVSAVAQYAVGTPVFRGFGDREVDRPAANLVFGLAGRAGERWRWDVSFQEDVPADTPAVDFTLGFRLSRVW